MAENFEEEVLAMDMALHKYREELRTDKEFREEMNRAKRYMFAEDETSFKIVSLSDKQGKDLK